MDMGTKNCEDTYIHACRHDMHHVNLLHTIVINQYMTHLNEASYIKIVYTPHMEVFNVLNVNVGEFCEFEPKICHIYFPIFVPGKGVH